jgi:hypothetical protein
MDRDVPVAFGFMGRFLLLLLLLFASIENDADTYTAQGLTSALFTLCFECDATQTVQRASCPAEKKVAFGTEQKRRNKR